MVVIFTNFVSDIIVISEKEETRQFILNQLDRNGINKYTFIKSDKVLAEVKNKILFDNKDYFEWLNIERKGMKYIINFEPKVNKDKKEELDKCNIVSLKDGMITKVISSKGVELVEMNDSVKKGDILISGEIKKDEEVVGTLCATGKVYAKTWYTVNVSTTKTYEKKIVNKKYRYNIKLSYRNKNKILFRSRVNEPSVKSQKIIDFMGIKVYLQREYESVKEVVKYSNNELDKRVDELVKQKMKNILKDDGRIINKKTLKKVDNNSKIDIEIFIVAEEQIGIRELIEEKDDLNG